MSGRLEVYYRGQWGTACDNEFNNNAAMVVCQQLGFNPGPAGAFAVPSAHFGQGTGPIWLNGVSCNGLEPNITSCQHNAFGLNYCDHSKDIGVICNGK